MATTADMPYDALYTEHRPAARRLALSLVPEHAAEDVVSEAFTKVLAASGRHGPPQQFGPYLLAAVRNTAMSYHTRGRRLVPVADIEPAPAASAESVVSDHEDARLAGEAFRALPPRWRQVLWATAVEEVSAQELAQRWEMAPNAVSQLASRAREGLRQAYLNEHVRGNLAPGCRAVAPYMGAAVRGKAGRRHQEQLAGHLRGCEPCGQAYAGLRAMNNHLGELLVPAAVSGSALAKVLIAGHRGIRAGLRAHWPVAAGAAAASLAVLVPLGTGHLPFSSPPGAGAPSSPGSLPREPSSGVPVLADGVLPGGSLPGGDLPGASLPGGDLPGSALPGGSLPGGVLPGAPSPGSALPGAPSPGGVLDATVSAGAPGLQLAASTGAAVSAGSQAGQLQAGTAVLLASPVRAAEDAAGHAAGTVASLLPGQ